MRLFYALACTVTCPLNFYALHCSIHIKFCIQVLLFDPNCLPVISTTCRTVTRTRSRSKFTIEISNWSGLMVKASI